MSLQERKKRHVEVGKVFCGREWNPKKGTDVSTYSNDRVISSPRTSEQDKCFTDILILQKNPQEFYLLSLQSMCLQRLLCASTMLAMKLKHDCIGLSTLEVLCLSLRPAPEASLILTQGGSQKSTRFVPNTCLKVRQQIRALSWAWLCYICHLEQTADHLPSSLWSQYDP
jgi:hypothetical protein